LFGKFLKEIKITVWTKVKSCIPHEILSALFFKVKLMDKQVVNHECQLYLNVLGVIIFCTLENCWLRKDGIRILTKLKMNYVFPKQVRNW